MSNVINFEKEKLRRMEHKILDTYDAVLDVSDVVLTTDDLTANVEITEDMIIIKANDDG